MNNKKEKKLRKDALKKLHKMTDDFVKDTNLRFYSSSRKTLRSLIRRRYGNKAVSLVYKDLCARYVVV